MQILLIKCIGCIFFLSVYFKGKPSLLGCRERARHLWQLDRNSATDGFSISWYEMFDYSFFF